MSKEIFKYYAIFIAVFGGIKILSLILQHFFDFPITSEPLLVRGYIYYFGFIMGASFFSRGLAVFSQINLSRKSMGVIFIGGFIVLSIVFYVLTAGILASYNYVESGSTAALSVIGPKNELLTYTLSSILKMVLCSYLGIFVAWCYQRFPIRYVVFGGITFFSLVPLGFFLMVTPVGTMLAPYIVSVVEWAEAPWNFILSLSLITFLFGLSNWLGIQRIAAIAK